MSFNPSKCKVLLITRTKCPIKTKYMLHDTVTISDNLSWTLTLIQSPRRKIKVRKRAQIRNRYNQAPHLTQDTNGKVTTPQLDITNESQGVSPFPASGHKASTNRRAWSIRKQGRNDIKDPQKKHRLGKVSKTLGLLKWNIKVYNKNLKSTTYTTLEPPQPECASTVWSPIQQQILLNLKLFSTSQPSGLPVTTSAPPVWHKCYRT